MAEAEGLQAEYKVVDDPAQRFALERAAGLTAPVRFTTLSLRLHPCVANVTHG
jgi:hypothetical protein